MLNHENIASLVDFIIPENLNDLSVLYIVFRIIVSSEEVATITETLPNTAIFLIY